MAKLYVKCTKAHEGSHFTQDKLYEVFGDHHSIFSDLNQLKRLYEMNDGTGMSCIGSVIFKEEQDKKHNVK